MSGGLKKLVQGVENTSSVESISENQRDILNLLTKEFLTVKTIAIRKKTSVQAIYKTVNKLKKLGLLGGFKKSGFKGGVTPPIKPPSDIKTSMKNKFRLHAQAFKIKLLSSSPQYDQLLKLSTQIKFDKNTVMIYRDELIIYYNKYFVGSSVDECVKTSLLYTEKLLVMLENKYNIILLKKDHNNIKEFRGEIAKVGDTLAREVLISGSKLRIYDDRGVLRLLVDNSFQLEELETVSSDYQKDMYKVENFYKDVLQKDTLLLSEVKDHLAGLQTADNVSSTRLEKIEQILFNIAKQQESTSRILNKLFMEQDSTPTWNRFI